MNKIWIVALAAMIGTGPLGAAYGAESSAKAKTEQTAGRKAVKAKKSKRGKNPQPIPRRRNPLRPKEVSKR